MLDVDLYEAAGRNAYLAGCCAARALVFEDSGRVVSRHRSLWGDITAVLHQRGQTDAALTGPLPSLYVLKRVADYETGSSEISEDRAAKAVADADAYVWSLLEIAQAAAAPGHPHE
jgi:hypothetical protein